MSGQTLLVTGGAGYIGSHTVVALVAAGHDVVILDDLSNAKQAVMDRIAAITGTDIPLIVADMRDATALNKVFSDYKVDAVIHFAGLKAVGESVAKPLIYFDVNVGGTIRLLQTMEAAGVTDIVFSSSATVYGHPQSLPLTEGHPLSVLNPYGRTKLMIEDILRDVHASDPGWRIRMLRYFNPCGAHPSGLIGEDPKGVPNNLVPYIAQVASGRRDRLSIWGHDYETPDGTGVRDYIHVQDLADGHLHALNHLQAQGGCEAFNLGTGDGYSVLEMIDAFERASSRSIPYTFEDRRPGDVASCYADPTQAEKQMGWKATRTLDDMCRDHWNWQRQNPNGYAN